MLRLIFLAIFVLVSGCSSLGDGAKVVEGTDLTLGVSLPYADTGDAMTVINYLTGFRLSVDENSRCKLKYTCSETNDYFGCVHTRVNKSIEADIEPTIEEEEVEQSPEQVSEQEQEKK